MSAPTRNAATVAVPINGSAAPRLLPLGASDRPDLRVSAAPLPALPR
jgi:hypothetical protein